MHPIFSSVRSLLAVTGIWMALSLFAAYFIYLQLDISFLNAITLFSPLIFFFIFFCISNYYICLRLPVRRVNFLRLIITQVMAIITTVVLWVMCGLIYVLLLNKITDISWFPLYTDSILIISVIGAMLYCFWILAHYIYLIAQQHDEIERSTLQKKLLISETELQTVKATVHPHFLFNSLNAIANLSLTDPQKVHNMCLQISEFLRYSVSYSQKTTATVGEELVHIQNYLSIERERFGDRLNIVFDVDDATRSEPILPLLLFPLVENSVKHGIDSSFDGGTLKIDIKKNADVLKIQIENTYDELGRKPNGAGIGLDSVKKRLSAYYGGSSKVEISRNSEKFTVNITLPLLKSLV